MQYFPSLCSLCNVQYLEAWDELQWNGRRVQYVAKSVSPASLSAITKWQNNVCFFGSTLTVKQHWWPIFQLHNGLGGWFWIAWEESPLKKTACCCMHIAKSKGLGTPLVSVAGWRVSSSGTQTDSDGGVVTLVTVGDGPTCPGQSCSVRPPERSRAQPRQQHRTLVVPHLCLVV